MNDARPFCFDALSSREPGIHPASSAGHAPLENALAATFRHGDQAFSKPAFPRIKSGPFAVFWIQPNSRRRRRLIQWSPRSLKAPTRPLGAELELMLPGFRFLFAAIVLTMSILIFGLGAAALLRASHDQFASLPALRPLPEPVFAQRYEPPAATLAMLRFEPTIAETAPENPPPAALIAPPTEPAPEAVPVPPVETERLAALRIDDPTPPEAVKPEVAAKPEPGTAGGGCTGSGGGAGRRRGDQGRSGPAGRGACSDRTCTGGTGSCGRAACAGDRGRTGEGRGARQSGCGRRRACNGQAEECGGGQGRRQETAAGATRQRAASAGRATGGAAGAAGRHPAAATTARAVRSVHTAADDYDGPGNAPALTLARVMPGRSRPAGRWPRPTPSMSRHRAPRSRRRGDTAPASARRR